MSKKIKVWQAKAAKRRKQLSRANKLLLPPCNSARPCGYLVCPECRGRAQMECLDRYLPLLTRAGAKSAKPSKWRKQRFFTAVAEFGSFKGRPPNAEELAAVRKAYARQFRDAAPNASFLGCLDISENVAIDGSVTWVAHVHGVALNFKKADREAVSASLRKSGKVARRPLVVQKAANPAKQLAYCTKAQFSQRKSYIDKKGRANTRNRELSVTSELTLCRGLTGLAADQRFFRRGEFVKATRNRSGE